jgi:hypothetical protein
LKTTWLHNETLSQKQNKNKRAAGCSSSDKQQSLPVLCTLPHELYPSF